MENKDNAQFIADMIAQNRYEYASKIVNSRIESNFYKVGNPAENIHTIPEAFFTTYKNISKDEILEILESNDFEAFNNHFTHRPTGIKSSYEAVMSIVLDGDNIANQTAKFIKEAIGEVQSNQYLGNLKNQKIVAEQIIAEYFSKVKFNGNMLEEFKSVGLLSMARQLENNYQGEHLIKLPTAYENAKITNYGVPYFTILKEFKVADFSTCTEVRHMLTDEKVIKRIKTLADEWRELEKPKSVKKHRLEI
ncbi:TPA: hypothetical protein N0H21_001283 [Pseudomonas aeruginosa]|nr:hypothetical protein [Pseudomonas aeruginosa]